MQTEGKEKTQQQQQNKTNTLKLLTWSTTSCCLFNKKERTFSKKIDLV